MNKGRFLKRIMKNIMRKSCLFGILIIIVVAPSIAKDSVIDLTGLFNAFRIHLSDLSDKNAVAIRN